VDIKEIQNLENGSKVNGTFLVDEFFVKPYRGKEGFYLSFISQDKTGKIPCVVWDDIEQAKSFVKNGSIIFLEGTINEYHEKKQIIVSRLKIEKDYDPKNFLPCSDFNSGTMIAELISIMNNIQDVDLLLIWKSYRDDEKFINLFKECPAGKGIVHHARLGGLLEHTLSMLKTGEFLADNYNANKDILKLGIFLHDSGKLFTYKYDMAIELVDQARLFNHSAIGFQNFMQRLETIQIEEPKKTEIGKHIGHMILSHHGTYEYQASVIPMTKEAYLLSKIDDIDSKMDYINVLFKLKPSNSNWTEWDSLTSQFYYNTFFGNYDARISTKRRKIS
jgi:3'-5' exoribonuclease